MESIHAHKNIKGNSKPPGKDIRVNWILNTCLFCFVAFLHFSQFCTYLPFIETVVLSNISLFISFIPCMGYMMKILTLRLSYNIILFETVSTEICEEFFLILHQSHHKIDFFEKNQQPNLCFVALCCHNLMASFINVI